MRTIFFKITSLLQHPVLPVFVFGQFSDRQVMPDPVLTVQMDRINRLERGERG
jgi:hypothetical protein